MWRVSVPRTDRGYAKGVTGGRAQKLTTKNLCFCRFYFLFDSTVCNRARAQAVGGAVAGPVRDGQDVTGPLLSLASRIIFA